VASLTDAGATPVVILRAERESGRKEKPDVSTGWANILIRASQSKGGAKMARCLPLNDRDKAALRALDNDFTINADGETATVAGEMEVCVVRPADDGGAWFWLTIKFPGGETLDVRIARAQLLQ
jgi:hypothetical protein